MDLTLRILCVCLCVRVCVCSSASDSHTTQTGRQAGIALPHAKPPQWLIYVSRSTLLSCGINVNVFVNDDADGKSAACCCNTIQYYLIRNK